ncbi:unnamed protein product [Rotaria sordida]|uniref:TIL domain-containing protein n=1 Tax=Rotaria sordida TaxID=392033 RepID=A0A818M5J0_9BILA|nr:unnamed protein product [Rotaria sordida]CAF3584762.1 unnamed protein product [Rotaria sordida]
MLFLSIYVDSTINNVRCGTNEKCMCGPSFIETCDYKPKIYTMNCPTKENSPKCTINEEYQQCGSACPPTCYDYSYPLPKEPQACIAMCKPGCFCKQGYYRAKNDECVRPEKCCTGDNEQYTDCGSACVETCNYVPQFCTDQCVRGCFCQSTDYVRKDNSTASPCIKRDQCPK